MPDSSQPFGIEPELAPKLVAFDRLFKTIVAPDDIIESLRERFIAEFPWGRNTIQIEQMLQDTLGGIPWQWQWHQQWRNRFETIGVFPRMWTTLSKIRPRALRETGSFDHRIFLLSHTLVFMGYGERIWERCFAEQPLIRIGNPISDEPEPIIDILRRCASDYAQGTGPAEPPPFFPGDRSGVDLVLSTSQRMLERSARLGIICRRRPRPE